MASQWELITQGAGLCATIFERILSFLNLVIKCACLCYLTSLPPTFKSHRLLFPKPAPQTQPTERHGVQRTSPRFFRRQLSPFASISPISAVPHNFFHGGSKPKGMPESGARESLAGRAAEGGAQPKTGRAGELAPKGDLGRRAAALRRAQARHLAAPYTLRSRALQPPSLQLPFAAIALLPLRPLLHRRVEASGSAGFCTAPSLRAPGGQRSRRDSAHRKKERHWPA